MDDETIEKDFIFKSVNVETYEVSEEDLMKINKFTLSPVTAEEVYVFKTVVGDNELDDRNFEPFNLNALKDLKELYIGKTVIKDHRRNADNQVARIFDTELVQDASKLTGAGEIYTKLVTKQYMIKTSKNKDLIAEIKGGIKKEVSTGCKPKHAYCSICGTDNTSTYCNHYWGKEYNTVEGKKICYFTLDGAKEAYELSLVAVPAQPRAGTTKNYGAKIKNFIEDNEKENKKNNNINKESELKLKLKVLDSFLFINKNILEDTEMNKKMRELATEIKQKSEKAKKFMEEGENQDFKKANDLYEELKELEEQFKAEKNKFELEKRNIIQTIENDSTIDKTINNKDDGFNIIAKMLGKKVLTESEKNLIVGGDNGEDYLVPEDVRTEIREIRRNYISLKDLVNVIPVTTLSGSTNYESSENKDGKLTKITTDGEEIVSSGVPKFIIKPWKVEEYGDFIPISRLLLGNEKAHLLSYINKWFVRKAINSENDEIITTLKSGKSAKVLKGWKALKTSINKDLDPASLIGGVILTNQTGFTILDEEEDANGRPILQQNPAEPTKKVFQGLPIHVVSDTILPNVSGKAPIFYGNLKEGCDFMDREQLKMDVSEHYLFNKNMNCLRIIELFDTVQTDADAYMYGTLEATPASVGA